MEKGVEDLIKEISHNEVKNLSTDWVLPDGEIRLTRKKWPKNSSPVVVNIVFEGLVFTVARAEIVVLYKDSKGGERNHFYMAEGISRISPLDEDRRDQIVGEERAIKQAIKALHVRVTKHRRSHHHYRG